MTTRIRSMISADADNVRWLCGILGYPSTPSDFERRLVALQNNPSHAAFVALSDSHTVVGWVHVYEAPSLLSPSTAELGGLIVAPTTSD